MTTEERQEAIKELILHTHVSDQMQLVQLLKEKYGIQTNQAVVSRDLHKLNIVKKLRKGELAYEIASLDVKQEILKLAVLDIVHNESMILIKTYPGIADFVGDFLDQCLDLDILGCLSGENTIFVTPKSTKTIHQTYLNLCKRLYFK
jgi:transcriptional regulator of arginine metabolism